MVWSRERRGKYLLGLLGCKTLLVVQLAIAHVADLDAPEWVLSELSPLAHESGCGRQRRDPNVANGFARESLLDQMIHPAIAVVGGGLREVAVAEPIRERDDLRPPALCRGSMDATFEAALSGVLFERSKEV